MFEIKCTDCGKTATVPFNPTEGKPVYCSTCFSKRSLRSRETGEFGLVLTRNRHRPDEERAIEEERKKCLQTFSNAPKVVHD